MFQLSRRALPVVLLALAIAAPLQAEPARPASGASGGSGGPTANPAALRAKAIEQVLASSQSSDPFLRANAIEAAQAIPDQAAPIAQLGLDDKSPAVRFVAVTTIGKLRLKDLVPAVEQRLAAEKVEMASLRTRIEKGSPATDQEIAVANDALAQSRSVCAAVLFALRRCDRPVDITPLAGMLSSSNLSLRANAVLLLGLMGDRSALPLLEEMAKVPALRAAPERQALLRLQFTEAMVRLGNEAAIEPLRAAMYSQFPEARVLAVTLVGEFEDKTMLPALGKLFSDPKMEEVTEVRVAAAAAMARMGDGRGAAVLYEAAKAESPLIRAMAGRGLGFLRDNQSMAVMAGLLSDKEEQVRLTAAAAILRAVAPGV